ncbi:HAMP domain-containing sensor histidine kinase [Chloroflexus sp.]|uniref:sensor histidine kinase n=1 Tax=Chloroflexus sp. TaxID=1904827 RepID=UPI00298EDFF1|nr:HAMP domain-containing sensor histidine kinase [Chloroflexus sp.]MDW8404816.1 HAMP domain-containing sensor histidine kinase [Chloroflexus sp.]
MTHDAHSSVAEPYPALSRLSPLTVTERVLCCALAEYLPPTTWLVIGPTAWPVAGGAARPTPIWPLPASRMVLADAPVLREWVGTAGWWEPLIARGCVVGGLIAPGETPVAPALLAQLAPLVDVIYTRRMAARQIIWQRMLLQIKERYAAGEERGALLSEVFSACLGLALQPATEAQALTIDTLRMVGRSRPLWPDEAAFAELVLAVTHPAIKQAQVLSLAAAGIAHDINNLLTVILGRAQLLELDVVGEQIADLQMIESAAEVGANGARRLQRFAQFEQLQMQPVELAAIARSAVALAERELAKRGTISLVAELADLPLAAGHAGLLHTALVSLIMAAAQAMPSGGVVRVSGDADERYVWIEVADPGLPPNTDLHSAAAQTQRAHTIELAIARQTARVHHGHLRVVADPAGGTIIQLQIPRFSERNE